LPDTLCKADKLYQSTLFEIDAMLQTDCVLTTMTMKGQSLW